jgi:hypothetical protein
MGHRPAIHVLPSGIRVILDGPHDSCRAKDVDDGRRVGHDGESRSVLATERAISHNKKIDIHLAEADGLPGGVP